MVKSALLKFFFALSSTRLGGWFFTTVTPPLDRWLMLKSAGRYSLAGLAAPVLLLTTTGRRSGQVRHAPILYLPFDVSDYADAQDHVGKPLAVLGSRGGRVKHAAWYYNLLDQPSVQVHLGGAVRPYQAHVAQGDAREQLWRRFVDFNPGFARYQARIARNIPVVVLTPSS